MQDFHEEFEFAKEVVTKASDIILSYYKTTISINYKDDNSPLTIADTETEMYIRNTLSQKFPSYGFLGEETEDDVKEVSWIVDPIDGTSAFSRGINDFGTALALKSGSDVIFSVESFPTQHELYFAYKNEGAFCNDSKIFVSKTNEIKKALISFGSEAIRDQVNHKTSLRLALGNRVRIAPSSVIESTYLATGKTDIVLRFKQKIWDVIPECLLMEEAGAIVTDHQGNKLQFIFDRNIKYDYIASNPQLIETYKDLLYLPKEEKNR